MFALQIFTFALFGITAASPLSKRWEELRTKHEWSEIPSGWEDRGPASPDAVLDLRIGLKQDGFDELVEHLYAVSDPAHTRYGAHLSKEDVDALIAPHQETVALVDAWLLYHEVDVSSVSRSDAGDWLSVTVTVEEAERMLGASYRNFHNPASDTTVVRTLRYQLPAILHDHVEVVTPTTYLSGLHSMKTTSSKVNSAPITVEEVVDQLSALSAGAPIPNSCNTTITPACLRQLYNINYTPQDLKQSQLGITGYLEQFANFADLTQFYKEFQPISSKFNFSLVLDNGGLNTQSDPGLEANLDTQYGGALSFPIPNTYYSTGGSPPFKPDENTPTNTNEPYINWVQFILAQKDIPATITTSYGDDEQTVPPDYAKSVCAAFAQLGARGVSLLFASGDFAVGAGDCLTNDGKNLTKFIPNFPASCPFVTTVGGTTQIKPEVGISFSGGGFSNYFSRPSYQEDAVNNYLQAFGDPFPGLFDLTGRAYPDVSAQSFNFQVILGGSVTGVEGTSCATPTFAAVISLLNDVRFASGKAPLGFLNPFLYSTGASGLNDITIGSNPGCGTSGFRALKGWDPVTGLGTPDFAKLKVIVDSIP